MLRIFLCVFISFCPNLILASFSGEKKWKMQTISKIILEILTHKKFDSVRPEWLKNPLTGRNLELDCFNLELRLAMEYNGKQHYEYTSHFHSSEDKFVQQVVRDEIKKDLCDENRVTLIIVPYTIQKENLTSYILDKLLFIQNKRKK